jgi:hypothetical protein
MDQPVSSIRLSVIFAIIASALLWGGCDDSVTQPVPPPRGPGPMLFVAHDGGGTGYLSGIDLDSGGAVSRGFEGLGRLPNSIIYKENKIYVLNTSSQDINILEIADSNFVRSIDTVDVSFGGNRSPSSMAMADNGDIYISNFADNSVSILDGADRTIRLIIPNVGKGPQGVLADDDKIYVCISGVDQNGNTDSLGYVGIISTVSPRVYKRIPVGINPQYIIKDNAGEIIAVCSGTYGDDNGQIFKISARLDSVVQVIEIRGNPGDIAIAGQFAYLSNYGDANNGFLYRYRISDGRIFNSHENPILVSKGAGRIVARSNGSIFVSCWEADKVEEIVGVNRVNSWSAGDGPGPLFIYED